MNITGLPQYSAAASVLRQPTQNKNSDFRLVFIYPMIFDQMLTMMPVKTSSTRGDGDNLQDLLRNFVAVNMLNEVFVSNSLNLISLASKLDFNPKRDPNKVEELVGALLRGDPNAGQMRYSSYRDYPAISPDQLQNKINQKTAVIKQMLSADPRLKKLNPFMEIVTLNNMIDVPVIAGTSSLQVDTSILYLVLAVASAYKIKLDNTANIDKVFSILAKKVAGKEESKELYKIFKNADSDTIEYSGQAKLTGFSKIMDFISHPIKSLSGNPSQGTISYGSLTPNPQLTRLKNRAEMPGISTSRKDIIKSSISEIDSEAAANNVTMFLENKLKEAHVFFKLVTDQNMIYNRSGLTKEAGQMKGVMEQHKGKLDNMMDKVFNNFYDVLSGPGNTLLRSAHNVLLPREIEAAVTNTGAPVAIPTQKVDAQGQQLYVHVSTLFDYPIQKEKIFDEELGNNLKKILKQTSTDLGIKLETGETSDNKNSLIKQVNRMCEFATDDGSKIAKSIANIINDTNIGSTEFNHEQFVNFMESTSDVSSQLTSIIKKFEQNVGMVFDLYEQSGQSSTQTYLIKVEQAINDSVEKFINTYSRYGNPNAKYKSNFVHIESNIRTRTQSGTGIIATDTSVYDSVIRRIKLAIKTFFYYSFLLVFQFHLCDFISLLDVDVDIAANDVLDFPNYSLVIPLEIVQALHRIIAASSWKDAVVGGYSRFGAPNEAFTKKIVKFVAGQLGVPNLFVVDKFKEEVYYKLQTMDNRVEKCKLSSLDTFVKTNLNKQIVADQNYY